MAKQFDLVNLAEISTLGAALSNSTAQARLMFSQYALSAINHFAKNGKKIDVLQEQVDFLLTNRYKDLDVLAIALRTLTPIKISEAASNGKKKWITIEGTGAQVARKKNPDMKPEKVSEKNVEDNGVFNSIFAKFAAGDVIKMDNPDFYTGCNKDKVTTSPDYIPETNEETFDQDLFTYAARVKEIADLKKAAKAAREAADKGEKVVTSISTEMVAKAGGYKSLLNTKVTNILDKITAEFVEQAAGGEIKSIGDALDSYEEELEELQEKIEAARELIKAKARAAAQAEEDRILAEAERIRQEREAAEQE